MARTYKQRANDSLKELVYASKIVQSCDDVMKAYMIDQDGLSMGVTSVHDAHFHVYKLNDTVTVVRRLQNLEMVLTTFTK
jgi:hypothetical protein